MNTLGGGTRQPYRVDTSEAFERAAKRFLRKHPELGTRLVTVRNALSVDPFAPALRIHTLSGDLRGQWAASLNYTYRIILTIDRESRVIRLEDLGSHEEVYGSGDDD